MWIRASFCYKTCSYERDIYIAKNSRTEAPADIFDDLRKHNWVGALIPPTLHSTLNDDLPDGWDDVRWLGHDVLDDGAPTAVDDFFAGAML